ncbi:carbamoyltransferase family protein [Halosimplex salinum]|uniref:carbamoyltransferase family protein n=1 Tax=Halosimplex salinum TaxID=1710538 RepID=UPI000F478091|nr:carbamoyltransferase C-terminal domain-containing protein [Halosimplex salinum]
MRYVLSFHPSVRMFGSHDPSAVIFRDGELVYGVEEERLTREKHAVNTFPEQAIRACLDHCDIGLRDVDKILLPWEPELYRQSLVSTFKEAISGPESARTKFYQTGQAAKQTLVSSLFSVEWIENRLEDLGSEVPPVETLSHHRCHAASALHPAPFDDGLVLSIDGRGEYDSTVVWEARNARLERVKTYEYPNSLGTFFGVVTKFLGYYPNNGEGKVMGLAPYGERNRRIESTLRGVIDTGVEYDVTELTTGGFESGVERLEALFGRSRNKTRGEFDQWEKDLAFTAQYLLEETVTEIAETYLREFGTSNVGLAGGVALNCKMNRRVMELDAVDGIFIQPVANDAGTAIGAGMLESGPRRTSEMTDVYWGPSFSTETIEERLETNKLDYERPDDLERAVAERLADGDLVGWFQNRLEMGPRALGNRSILADPRTEASRDRVNKFVKHREEWRPFAPSMLEEAADEYLENAEPSSFMIKTFSTRPEARDDITAVLHPSDQTTRPQTVREDQNPRYYRLISEFEDVTGVPVVLNTSFNDHGEPVVTKPNEAIKDFFGMGLDTLVLQDLIVEKR